MDENKSPQDFLNEIFEQSQQSIPSPASPPEKGRRTYLLLYFIILLSAAFLILLISALRWRDAAQVKPLEKELAALQKERDELEKELEEEQKRDKSREWEFQRQQRNDRWIIDRCNQIILIDCLEQFVDTGDYLMAAVMIRDVDIIFNRHASSFDNEYLIPAQERQYLALRDTILYNGAITLSRTTTTEGAEASGQGEEDWGGHYVERLYVAEGRFDQAELDTAWHLFCIFWDYATAPFYAADTIESQFQPDSEGMEILTGGAFQPSTVERFQQVKTNLIEEGILEENEDGTLRRIWYYA